MLADDVRKMTTRDLQALFCRPPLSDRLAELGLRVVVLSRDEARLIIVDLPKLAGHLAAAYTRIPEAANHAGHDQRRLAPAQAGG